MERWKKSSARGNPGGLLRSRSVRVVLVLAAVGSAVGTVQTEPSRFRSVSPLPVLPTVRAASPERAADDPGETLAVEHQQLAVQHQQLAVEHQQKGYDISPELARDIHQAAAENGIEPEVAFGLVRAESGFRNSATSYVGAVGLTQLMPRTAAWLEPGTTPRDLRDPDTNLRIGFSYLRDLIEKYDGDVRMALLAYNRGPGTVDRLLRRGRNPDNGYARKVMGG